MTVNRTPEQKALELATQVTLQIQEERSKLAAVMASRGYTPDKYAIADNIEDVCNGLTLEYKCTAVLKPTK